MTGQQSFANSFFQVADKNRHIFAGKEDCAMKNWTKAIESDLNQVKKAGTLSRKEIVVQTTLIEIW